MKPCDAESDAGTTVSASPELSALLLELASESGCTRPPLGAISPWEPGCHSRIEMLDAATQALLPLQFIPDSAEQPDSSHEQDRWNETWQHMARSETEQPVEARLPLLLHSDGDAHLVGAGAGSAEPPRPVSRSPSSGESLAYRLPPIGLAVFHAETGAIIETNAAFLELLGHSREATLNRNFAELGLMPDQKSLGELLAALRASGGYRGVPFLHRANEAGKRTVLLDAQQITGGGQCLSVALLRDITECRIADTLATSARCFSEQLVATANEGILVIDESRRIRIWNLFMEQLTGHAARDVVGLPAAELFSDARLPGFSNLLARGLAGETLPAPDTFVVMPGQQREFWVSCRIAPILDRHGAARGAIVFMRDITERKRLEQRLINIVEREHQRISQDLHDDLGQHLTAISLTVDLVRRRTDLAGRSREDLDRVSRLLEDLHLNIRSIVRGLQPVAPHARGLMEALDILVHGEVAPPDTRVSFDCPRPVLVDSQTVAMQVYRIAQEAVNNAVKHAQARNIRIALRRHRAQLVLEVADDGTGLPKLHQLALGEGAGLRIMRYRAESIGGHLDVHPRKPQGTLVRCIVRAGAVGLAGAQEPTRKPSARSPNL